MALITSTLTGGDFATGSTWIGGARPTVGVDTIIIDGPVTVSANDSVGNSPSANTIVCTIRGPTGSTGGKNGSLTINAGITFTLNGTLSSSGGTVTLGAGGTIKLDGSGATTPSAATYALNFDTSTDAKLVCNGTSGSRCTVLAVSTNSAGAGRITGSSSQVDATYTDFSRINPFGGTGASGRLLRCVNCTFDACNGVGIDLPQEKWTRS